MAKITIEEDGHDPVVLHAEVFAVAIAKVGPGGIDTDAYLPSPTTVGLEPAGEALLTCIFEIATTLSTAFKGSRAAPLAGWLAKVGKKLAGVRKADGGLPGKV